MKHRLAIDILKEEREKRSNKLKYQIQTKDAAKELKAQIVKINKAIFVLIKDAAGK